MPPIFTGENMARKAQTDTKTGKLDPAEIRALLNKKAGRDIAFSLENENPSEVVDWIGTGSTWLDAIIDGQTGKRAGIPVGRISELAGDTASGKSYMAAQIAANAQRKGMDVIYFDSESAIDPTFLERAGCDLSRLIYMQAENVEGVLEQIELLLTSNSNKMLFIWDSFAFTPSLADINGGFDPMSQMAVKPRITALGLSKLIQPIANAQATLLILNQLKTNLAAQGNIKYLTDGERYTTPGGKALAYSYSLRIWLTARRAKDSFILDERGFRVGSEIKARLEKSRFGSAGRECAFKISWSGEHIGVLDTESLFEAIKPFIQQMGAWYGLPYEDGTVEKFQESMWMTKMENEKFCTRVLEIVDIHLSKNFANKTGDAKNYYNIDGEPPQQPQEEE
jgi:recombination protein RecA